MTTPKFNIGDKVWVAVAGNHNQIWTICPDCLGKMFLTVIVGNGSQITIDCECCKRGYEGCKGKIQEYQFQSSARQITVENIEFSNGQFRYNYNDEVDVFATEPEATKRAESLRSKHELEESERLKWHKENAHKTWAWNATYHRRSLKEALRNVEYHTAKLNVAKLKSKEKIIEDLK